jgi:small-conductance mechanosensitive channel
MTLRSDKLAAFSPARAAMTQPSMLVAAGLPAAGAVPGSPPIAAPLRNGDFIVALFDQLQRWLGSLGAQLQEMGLAVLGLASAFSHATPPRDGLLLAQATALLAGLMAAGLLLEWLAGLLLSKPRRFWLRLAKRGRGSRVGDVEAGTGQYDRLHALVFALGLLLLDALPLLAFLVATVLALPLADGTPLIRVMAMTLAGIYVAVRLLLVALRRLLETGPSLSVLHVSPPASRTLLRWLRVAALVIVAGALLGDAVPLLGAVSARQGGMLKLAMLLAGLTVVVLLFRLRFLDRREAFVPVETAGMAVQTLRRWFAAWSASLASLLLLGFWSMLILGLREGLPRLTRMVVITAVILIAARLVAAVLLGALTKTLRSRPGGTTAGVDGVRHDYPWLRRSISAIVGVVALLVLLQAWGVDVDGWLFHSAVGQGLLRVIATLLVTSLAAIAAWEAVVRGITRRIAYWTGEGDKLRASRWRTLLPMVRTGLFAILVLAVVLAVLGEAGVNTAPLIASAGVVGIAVGFGSQKLVQDFITGVFLLLENAMQVGDTVTVASVAGTVEELSLRTVRLRGGDGSLYIVPFSAVTTVNNASRGLGNASVSVDIAADGDVGAAIGALQDIGAQMRQEPAFAKSMLGGMEIWGVNAMDGFRINILGQVRCTDTGRWGVQREINRRVVKRFRQMGLALADPNQRAVRLLGNAGAVTARHSV